MTKMLRFLPLCLLLLAGCGEKKKNTGSSGSATNDFTETFPELTLKYMVSDTALRTRNVGGKPLEVKGKNYFPDSLYTPFFGKTGKPKFFAIGRAKNGDKETYLVMRAEEGAKRAIYLLGLDEQLKYRDGLLLCFADNDPAVTVFAAIDKSFNILIHKEVAQGLDKPLVTDRALAYNEGRFMDVLTNNPEKIQAVINPIDTFSSKHRFAGDYMADERNFVSIRDGRDSGSLRIFYHFEKEGECNGEVKDELHITGRNTAEFRKDGDPCVFLLTFTNNQLTLKEDHGCGNYRPLNCTLNGSFTRRKKVVAADTLKKAPAISPKAKPAAKPPVPAKPPAKKAPVYPPDVQ